MEAIVTVALIVAGSSAIGGAGGYLTSSRSAHLLAVQRREEQVVYAEQRRIERAEDKAEREAVSAQAREAARLLKANQETTVKMAAETLSTTKVIHTLVNSKLTGVTQRLLTSLIAQRALLGDVRGDLASQATRLLDQEIEALRIELNDRAVAAGDVEAKEAKEAKEA